jgi:hypothetical protein
MLQKAEQRGKIEGIKICRRAPRVNHLFFADDSLILMKARVNGAQELQYILDLYEQVAGQKINREKSSIMFSPNTGQEIRTQIKSDLSIDSKAISEHYLGLPISIGK